MMVGFLKIPFSCASEKHVLICTSLCNMEEQGTARREGARETWSKEQGSAGGEALEKSLQKC